MTKILVTGATGFIAGNLIPKLIELEHEVYALERYVTARHVLGGKRSIPTLYADLNDHFGIRHIIHHLKPEVVIHLASISPVSYSYNRPQEVLETNYNATINLAECCMRETENLTHFIFAGSSEEYGNKTEFPINEEAKLRPNSPYAASKVAADRYLMYMHDAYDFPVTVLRPFNTYGRDDNEHFVVERAISQLLREKTVRLGDPDACRDFLYVTDHVDGYLAALEHPCFGEAINICTGVDVSIRGLVNKLIGLTGFNGHIEYGTIPKRPLDIDRLVGDNEKALRLLKWKPKIQLEEGLLLTIEKVKKRLKA